MSPDDPRHGEYAGFQAHMKTDRDPCEPCRMAQRRYFKRMKFRLDNGHRERVALGQEAWDVIHSMSREDLARLAGMSSNHLSRLHRGGIYQKVYQRTRAKILATKGAPTPIGIQRRVRALYALGYSWYALSRESGIHYEAISRIARGAAPTFVRSYVTEALVATYDRLHMTLPPPSASVTSTRNAAQRHCWPPPLAYDEGQIDNPNYTPVGQLGGAIVVSKDFDEAVITRVLNGENLPTNKAERHEIMRRWLARGGSEAALCRRMGWKSGRYVGREADDQGAERRAS